MLGRPAAARSRGRSICSPSDAGVTPEGTVNYTYDAANRRAMVTVAGQTAISYSCHNADRVTAITQRAVSIGFAYGDANRRT